MPDLTAAHVVAADEDAMAPSFEQKLSTRYALAIRVFKRTGTSS
jgi:hypothetical protein